MQAERAEIQSIYEEFRDHWQSREFSRIKAYLPQLFRESKSLPRHQLGEFVILYTPIDKLRPDLLIVANNPSWFDKTDPEQAIRNLDDVAGRIPSVNSYIKHNHIFAETLREIFFSLGQYDLLKSCVGLNRFWIQTGEGFGGLFKNERRDEGRRLQEECANGTRRIIELLRPKAVAVLGADARKWIGTDFPQQAGLEMVVKCCTFPTSFVPKHRDECKEGLEDLIREANIGV